MGAALKAYGEAGCGGFMKAIGEIEGWLIN